MRSPLKALSLFSGAGGLDLGLKKAGFDFLLHAESDKDSCLSLKANGFTGIKQGPVDPESIAKSLRGQSIALVAGGPPCQPFSKSSQWSASGAKGFDDHRSSTVDDFIKVVKLIRPQSFLFENVPQFERLGGVERLSRELGTNSLEGYVIHHTKLNAANFGVAQNRSRIFVVGVCDDLQFDFPEGQFATGRRPSRTTWDYLVGLPEPLQPRLRGKWAPLIRSIPPGRNYLHHTSRGDGASLFGWRTRYWSFLYKLDPLETSPTIVASPSQNNGPYHWNNRELTTKELAALQSFPRRYQFVGDDASVRRQIGNAVPPLLAEHIGRALSKALGVLPAKRLALLPPRAKSPPTVANTEPIDTAFLRFVAQYDDHPGTGKGPKPRS